MQIKMKSPFYIDGGLNAALKVEGRNSDTISIAFNMDVPSCYAVTGLFGGKKIAFKGDGFRPSLGCHTLQGVWGELLFWFANPSDTWPKRLRAFCERYADDISALQMELEEGNEAGPLIEAVA